MLSFLCHLGAIPFNLGSRGLILVTFGVDFGAFGIHLGHLGLLLGSPLGPLRYIRTILGVQGHTFYGSGAQLAKSARQGVPFLVFGISGGHSNVVILVTFKSF